MFDKINRLSIEFTKDCNFRCTYCHQDHEPGYLSISDLANRVDFINRLDILDRNMVDITLTGGEVTIYENILEEYFVYLKNNLKANSKKFTLMSNMSNVDVVIGLLDKGLLRKDRVGFSWDGIGNNKTRVSDFTDDSFLEALNKIAGTKYKNDIAFQVAITKETLPKLYDTIKLLYDKGLTNTAMYLINGIEYTEEDALLYGEQLERISQLFIDSYINDVNRLRFFTFNKCFRDYIIRKDKDIEFTTRCRKIGSAIHITMAGNIYPCIYFGDHDIFKIGNIKEGIDKEMLNEFKKEYLSTPECIENSKCTIKHCLCCPAVSYRVRKGFNKRDLSHCKMMEVEKKFFSIVIKELTPFITDTALRNYWSRVHEPA